MRGYLKSNTIHTVWYHVSAFASILEIECALQITGMEKTTSVMNKCTNSASSVTELNGRLCFRLGSTQPQFLLCRKKKHCYTCNRHVRAFFHSSVLPICWAYCLSSLCHTGRQHSQEGEQELKHVEGGFLLFPPTQVVSKVTCGGILQEHCWNMLWFSSGSVFFLWKEGGNRDWKSMVHTRFLFRYSWRYSSIWELRGTLRFYISDVAAADFLCTGVNIVTDAW